jgi:hypothetical protein
MPSIKKASYACRLARSELPSGGGRAGGDGRAPGGHSPGALAWVRVPWHGGGAG